MMMVKPFRIIATQQNHMKIFLAKSQDIEILSQYRKHSRCNNKSDKISIQTSYKNYDEGNLSFI